MLSSQQQIISFVASRLKTDKSVWLCTILKTWGSSPRPVGAMMACTPDGELVGSLSGGCIEEDFLDQLQDGTLKSQYEIMGKPFTVRYGELARHIGRPKASRAVGAANGLNPIPVIIPCHRVIGSDGKLSGFGGGIKTKEYLLNLENNVIAGIVGTAFCVRDKRTQREQ